MQLACMTFSVGPGTLAENLGKIKGLGLSLADLSTGAHGQRQADKLKASKDPEGHAASAREEIDRLGMGISEVFLCHFGDPINHPDPAKRQRSRDLFTGFARYARLVGGQSIMMIPGPVHDELGPEASFELSAQELSYYVGVSQAEGIQLNIEPHYPSLAQSPEGTIRLCEAVPGLAITLDYSHFVAQGYTHDQVEPLHKYASHFHARQAKLGNRNAPRAEGTIDFCRVVKRMKTDGYDGVICLEYEPHDLDYIEETRLLKEEIEGYLAQ